MIRFARGNVKPDTPLLYLLPVFGVLLLGLIWSSLSDFLAWEHDRAVRNAVTEAATHMRAYERTTLQTLRGIDQMTRDLQHEYEKSRQRREPFDLAVVARRSLAWSDQVAAVSFIDRIGNATATFVPGATLSSPLPGNATGSEGEEVNVHRDADSRDLHVGKPVVSPILNRTIIPLTRRVNNPDGSFAGVMSVAVDPGRLTDPYDPAEQGRRGLLAVLGKDGVFRASRSGDSVSSGARVDYAQALALLQHSQANGVAMIGPLDDVSRFAAYRLLTPYDVVAIVAASEDDVMTDYREQRDYYIKYALVASLGIVGVLTLAMLLVLRMKQSHRAAEAARATYRAAAEGSADAFFLLRSIKARDHRVAEFLVEDANSRALQLLKLPRDRVVGNRLRKLLPKSAARRLYRHYFRALKSGKPIEEEIEIDWDRPGARWFRHQAVPIEDGFAVTLRDIDDAKQAQHNLERAANFDTLTSLPNRRQFIEYAGKAIERCKSRGINLGVLFIDLDNFKKVNDTLGHDVGDLLLQAVAERLQTCIRADDVLWRLGGDEFIVTMENVRNRAEAEVVCQRIGDMFRTPIVIRGISLSTSASTGVAFCPEDAEDANKLLKNADLAMYEAKEFGNGTYHFFTPALGTRRAARIGIEQDLRDALRRYELFVVYQPLLRLGDGEVVGLEALVRWQHPVRGMMLPTEFIPIAEESNLIHLLGDYVFQIACSQIKRWKAMGLAPIPVAVNVSPRQFAWEGIAERLLSIVEANGVSPELMQIELTESAIMKDSDGARRKLSDLKQHGVSVSVDDFGTGYSSLASLQSFPIDKLKIDRSFVERSDSPDGVAILRAIVLMAHALRITVVAEGVETGAQLELLRKIGCDQVQGFLIAQPVLADDVPAMLQRLDEENAPQKRRVGETLVQTANSPRASSPVRLISTSAHSSSQS